MSLNGEIQLQTNNDYNHVREFGTSKKDYPVPPKEKKNLHNLEHLISIFLVFKLILPLNFPLSCSLNSQLNKIFDTRSFSICRSHGFTSLETYSLPALVTGMEDILSLLSCTGCFSLSPCHNEDKSLSPMQRQPRGLREAG